MVDRSGKSAMLATAIIVCSDKRALMLARVLEPHFRVFLRSADSGTWTWSVLDHGHWKWIAKKDQALTIPKTAEVLFFHTGVGDPAGIPTDVVVANEFAFSGPGFKPGAVLAERKEAIPILRRFEVGECPVKAHHMPELLDYLFDRQDIPPSFCRPERDTPVLTAIAILCQTYLVTGIAEGQIPQDGEAAKLIEWQKLSNSAKGQLAVELSGWWKTIQSGRWWLSSLGVPESNHESSQFRSLVEELVEEFDYLGPLRMDRNLKPSEMIATIPVRDILSFLEKQEKTKQIAQLLNATNVEPAMVTETFSDVKAVLTLV